MMGKRGRGFGTAYRRPDGGQGLPVSARTTSPGTFLGRLRPSTVRAYSADVQRHSSRRRSSGPRADGIKILAPL
jgi:hypothetical protein